MDPLRAALMKPVEAFAERFGLSTLPLHAHQVIASYAAYDLIFRVISPRLSRWAMPTTYDNFPRRTKINWDVHVVSFVQAVFICSLALWGMFNDAERATWNAPTTEGELQRVFGYTAIGGAVQGYAAGYFVWDLFISTYYIDIFGLGFVAHALSALLVFGLGFVRLPPEPLSFKLIVRSTAPVCQLLRTRLHPLRTLITVSQHPLVL